ncbi:DEAD/DEAH box helicase, partial [bacterium]
MACKRSGVRAPLPPPRNITLPFLTLYDERFPRLGKGRTEQTPPTRGLRTVDRESPSYFCSGFGLVLPRGAGSNNMTNQDTAAEAFMPNDALTMGADATNTTPTFGDLGLPEYVKSQVDDMGFTIPTLIQAQAIPVALEGRDVVGIAQTGTGKTLAFALPMASRLGRGECGLVLAPTRELAAQIEEDFRKLGARTALLIGGAPMGKQMQQLRNRPDVIIATPGRLEDHMMQRTADLRNVTIAVLDEADRMLDMGFAPAIRRILEKTPKERQTLLFSATMPKEIAELAAGYLNNPVRIEVAVQGSANADVAQELIMLPQEQKHAMVE